MEVQYKTGNGQFVVNFDVKDAVGLFEAVADFQEVFEHNGDYFINGVDVPASDVQFRVRVVEDNKYFEKVYVGNNKDCWGFKLSYGQNKKGGGLFPKYYHEEDSNYKNGGGGWRKYIGGKDSTQEAETTAPAKGKAKAGASTERPF